MNKLTVLVREYEQKPSEQLMEIDRSEPRYGDSIDVNEDALRELIESIVNERISEIFMQLAKEKKN